MNILAKGAQSGKAEDVSHTESCLTHLLQESFGGNAKLTVICAISPEHKYLTLTTHSFYFLESKSNNHGPLQC